MGDRDDLLDIKQAAELLNVSETSLRRWTNAGQLACLRIGLKRERRFRRADLLAFMDEQPANGADRDVGSAAGSPAPPKAAHRTAVTPGNHLCGLYRSEQGRARLAASFLIDGKGLYPDSVCFLVALPKVREEILAHLETEYPAIGQDIDAGRLVLSQYHESADAQHDYWRTHFSEALRDGAQSVRVVGDMAGFFNTIGARALVDYEARYDRLITRRYPIAALCMCDARVFSAPDILDMLEVHADTLRYPVTQLLA